MIDVDRQLGDIGELVDLSLAPGHHGIELVSCLMREQRGAVGQHHQETVKLALKKVPHRRAFFNKLVQVGEVDVALVLLARVNPAIADRNPAQRERRQEGGLQNGIG